MAFICKFMAVLLTISLAGHFLYIIGFSLPGRDVQFGEWYSFTNHYLFLLDDRSIFALVPRFNSFFLEPSHIGTAAAFLLLTQIGKWRKWYCIVLFTTIFFTFSLAAYVFTIFNLFFSLWIQHKQMFRKLVITISLVVVAVITTFTYNNGDNLVHNLILLRLEVKGDKMSGDNRVTEGFEAEYDSFATTSDIIFGRDMDNAEFGNAGYRVFIYENGIVGVVLLIMFYTLSLIHATNKRALISAYLIALLYFWVEAKMLQDNIFISIYAIAYLKQFAHIS